jgi:hypothetical protein
VAPAQGASNASDVTRDAAAAGRAFAVTLHQLGLDRDTAHAVLDAALDELT